MTVKIYRYSTGPEKIDEFLSDQRLADSLYSKHLNYQIRHFQDREDPRRLVKIHIYKSLDDAAAAEQITDEVCLTSNEARSIRRFAKILC